MSDENKQDDPPDTGQRQLTGRTIIVDRKSFEKLVAVIENPPPPTPALIELMRDKSA